MGCCFCEALAWTSVGSGRLLYSSTRGASKVGGPGLLDEGSASICRVGPALRDSGCCSHEPHELIVFLSRLGPEFAKRHQPHSGLHHQGFHRHGLGRERPRLQLRAGKAPEEDGGRGSGYGSSRGDSPVYSGAKM